MRGLDGGERAALLISECQRAMVDPELARLEGLARQVRDRRMLANIAGLAAACRAAGLPVVHCTIVPRADFAGTAVSCKLMALVRRGPLRAGSPAADIDPAVAPEPGDFVIERQHGLTSFHGTELESVLRVRRIETVILTGVSTNVALPGTAIEAVNRGFTVVLPEDCTAGATADAHAFMVAETLPLLATVSTAAEVAAAVSGRQGPVSQQE
jgi:nicotinamidase-related amidase